MLQMAAFVDVFRILKQLMSACWQALSPAGILELLFACQDARSRSNWVLIQWQFCTEDQSERAKALKRRTKLMLYAVQRTKALSLIYVHILLLHLFLRFSLLLTNVKDWSKKSPPPKTKKKNTLNSANSNIHSIHCCL